MALESINPATGEHITSYDAMSNQSQRDTNSLIA